MIDITYILRRFTPYLTLLCVLWGSGCRKDNSDSYGDGVATISLAISTSSSDSYSRTNEDANRLGSAESSISRVRIFVFDGDKFDVMEYVAGNALHSYIIEMVIKRSSNKNFYVIVNEPEGASFDDTYWSSIKTIDALHNMMYTLSDYTVAGYAHDADFSQTAFELPMTGKLLDYNSSALSSGSPTVPINVVRSVARVDVYLQKKSADIPKTILSKSSTMDIKNTLAQGYLFGDTTPDGTTDLIPSTITNSKEIDIPYVDQTIVAKPLRVFSFYTPERTCDDTNEKLRFTLKDFEYGTTSIPVTFNEVIINNGANENASGTGIIMPTKSLKKIERNKVYKVYCTITSQGTLIEDIEISDWNDVTIDEDIVAPGVTILDISNEVVVEDKINISTVSVACTQGEQEIRIEKTGTGKEGSLAALGAVDFNNNSGDYKQLPLWLTAATWTPASDTNNKSGKFSFTKKYVMEGSERDKTYTIKLKCGEINQTLKVGYGETLKDLIITIDDDGWVDTPSDGGIDDLDNAITVPSSVIMNSKNFPYGGFTSGDIRYRGGPLDKPKPVSIYFPSNQEGTEWGDAVSLSNFDTEFNASIKPTWLKGATIVMDDLTNTSGHLTFTHTPNVTELDIEEIYIVKLQSGNVSRLMEVKYEEEMINYAIGNVYPKYATGKGVEGVVVAVTGDTATATTGTIVAKSDEKADADGTLWEDAKTNKENALAACQRKDGDKGWYLPGVSLEGEPTAGTLNYIAKEVLKASSALRATIGTSATIPVSGFNGVTPFVNTSYWSSTEGNSAWSVDFSTGIANDITSTITANRVRCVRDF